MIHNRASPTQGTSQDCTAVLRMTTKSGSAATLQNHHEARRRGIGAREDANNGRTGKTVSIKRQKAQQQPWETRRATPFASLTYVRVWVLQPEAHGRVQVLSQSRFAVYDEGGRVNHGSSDLVKTRGRGRGVRRREYAVGRRGVSGERIKRQPIT